MKNLLFLEWPPMSHESVEAIVFRELGFSVTVDQAIQLEELDSLVLQYDLNNYDVVVISVVPLNTTTNTGPEASQVNQIRRALQLAEEKKQSKIHLLGLHLSASSAVQERLKIAFDGMFIGQDTSDKERDKIIEKIVI